MVRGIKTFLVMLCLSTGTVFASSILVTTPGALGANDSADWSQLGADQTNLASSFNAVSLGGNAIQGNLTGINSIISVECPAAPSCSFNGGFNSGDSLIWTANGGTNPDGSPAANGPLTLSFSPVFGAGLFVQADAVGPFTASIQVFAGANSIFSGTEASGLSGNPIFIGVLDTNQEVTKVVFDLTACDPTTGPCNIHDFAVDSLELKGPTATPEPSSLLLLLAGTPVVFKRFRSRFSTKPEEHA